MDTQLVKVEGQEPELKIDGRTKPKAPNLVNLRYSKKLPVECNSCRYRPKDQGGLIGGCPVYQEGSLCKVRGDIRKAMKKFRDATPDSIIPLLEEEIDSNYEKLKFFEAAENFSGELHKEVTARVNAFANLSKVLTELKTRKTTLEIQERKTLSDDQKDEIARIVKMSVEEHK